MNSDKQDIILDLLCEQAVYGLSDEQQRQLAALCADEGMDYDPAAFEQAVAALSVASVGKGDPMPRNLRARLDADAERYFDDAETPTAQPAAAAAVPKTSGLGIGAWLGWAAAAAACIALVINIYNSRPKEIVQTPPQPPPQQRELTPAEARQRLMAESGDVVKAEIGSGNMKNISPAGDIVWSDAKQAGYIRVSGLPVNDKEKQTYQLWIFDATQDPKTPIDGGTFDISSSGEAVIPIDAKLAARDPKAFAITMEKPGGVVVSSREKVAALAKMSS